MSVLTDWPVMLTVSGVNAIWRDSTLIVYVWPTVSPPKRYAPNPFDITERVAPVVVSVNMTRAFGMPCPIVFTTRPVSSAWFGAEADNSTAPSVASVPGSPSLNIIRSKTSGDTVPGAPTAVNLRFSNRPLPSIGYAPYITTLNSPGSLALATAVKPRLAVPARSTGSA